MCNVLLSLIFLVQLLAQGSNAVPGKTYGKACMSDAECNGGVHLWCSKSPSCGKGTCACKAGYVQDFIGLTCLPTKAGQRCSDAKKCGGQFMECVDTLCQCQQGYQHFNKSGYCVYGDAVQLGQACGPQNLHCAFLTDTTPQVVECEKQKCQCPLQYTQTGNVCKLGFVGDPCQMDEQCSDGSKCILKVCGCLDGYSRYNRGCKRNVLIGTAREGELCDPNADERDMMCGGSLTCNECPGELGFTCIDISGSGYNTLSHWTVNLCIIVFVMKFT